MASGTIQGSGLVYAKISWSSSAGTAGSTVSATLYCQNRSDCYLTATCYGGYNITINGNKSSGSAAKTLSNTRGGSVTMMSHSVWVGYTGDKSITISGWIGTNGIYVNGSNIGNVSASGTATLDKVGSAPTMGSVTAPSTSTVSEKTTSITVKWNKASSYNNSVTYAIGCSINDGSYEWRYPDSNINTTSYTWDITPSQGDTYKFAVCCANDIARSGYQYSGVVTINKLNPPTIDDIETYNPYTKSTLNISLSGGSTTNGENFVRMCDLYYDDTWLCSAKSYADTPWKNTSQTISYAAANYASKLGTKAYSSNKFKITAWIENANRSRSSYVSKNFTVNINSDGGATPTLGALTISGGELGYTSTCFVAGISTINVSSPNASLRRAPSGTTLSYKIDCTGATTQNTQNAKFSNLSANTKTITVTATDSRGLSVSVTKTIVVQPYAAPTIRNYSVTRLDNPQTSATLIYELGYSKIYSYKDGVNKGEQLNTIDTQQYSKDKSTWTTASNGLIITGLSTESIYTIYLRVSDKVRTTTYTSETQKIPTIKTNLAIRKHGIGINCIPQSSYAFEVNGNAKINGSIVYGIGGRDRTPITMLTGDATGDGIKIESGGLVVIGSGESPSAFISGSGVGGNSEITYITSDNTIRFETNLDEGYANKQEFTMHANGQMTIPSHINLGGSLKKDGVSSSWVYGRINAAVRMNSISGYSPAISVKTTNGSWEIGAYDNTSYTDQLIFGYVSDSDYNAANNKQSKQYKLKASGTPDGETVLTLDSAFPVGAVYITYNNNNPGNFLGGTWVQFGQGRTLMGQGTGNDGSTSMTFASNNTGGNYTSPNLNCGESNYGFVKNTQAAYYTERTIVRSPALNASHGETNAQVSLLQPYIVVYFWRRTA